MNSTAVVIAIAYAVTVVLGSARRWLLARSATRPAETDHRKLARRENAWLAIVLVLLVSLLLSTIRLTPYGDEEEAAAAGTRVIEVTGAQFAGRWSRARPTPASGSSSASAPPT